MAIQRNLASLPRPHRWTGIIAGVGLVAVASADLLLHPSIFSAAENGGEEAFCSWFDIAVGICSICISTWPDRAERLLQAQSSYDWRGTEAVAPAGTAVRYQPALLILGAVAGWCVLLALISWMMSLMAVVAWKFWWQPLATAPLRSLVAWNLLSLGARSFQDHPRRDSTA